MTIERPDGALVVYRVRSATVVDHRNLVLPRHPATPTLTLITCYPFDAVKPGTPLRYVVVATAE